MATDGWPDAIRTDTCDPPSTLWSDKELPPRRTKTDHSNRREIVSTQWVAISRHLPIPIPFPFPIPGCRLQVAGCRWQVFPSAFAFLLALVLVLVIVIVFVIGHGIGSGRGSRRDSPGRRWSAGARPRRASSRGPRGMVRWRATALQMAVHRGPQQKPGADSNKSARPIGRALRRHPRGITRHDPREADRAKGRPVGAM